MSYMLHKLVLLCEDPVDSHPFGSEPTKKYARRKVCFREYISQISFEWTHPATYMYYEINVKREIFIINLYLAFDV